MFCAQTNVNVFTYQLLILTAGGGQIESAFLTLLYVLYSVSIFIFADNRSV